MNLHDILKSNSNEFKELLEATEKIKINIQQNVLKSKPSILGESFMDNNEVCEMLRISSRTLQDYRDKGLISFYKLEGKIIYKLSDIEKMLEKYYYEAWCDRY